MSAVSTWPLRSHMLGALAVGRETRIHVRFGSSLMTSFRGDCGPLINAARLNRNPFSPTRLAIRSD